VTVTVALNRPAGPGGISISIASSNSVASVPTTMTVASGQSPGQFAVSTSGIYVATTAPITASSAPTTTPVETPASKKKENKDDN